jgi:hypothetical protein
MVLINIQSNESLIGQISRPPGYAARNEFRLPARPECPGFNQFSHASEGHIQRALRPAAQSGNRLQNAISSARFSPE